ncbi:MAG: CocE/NonD family hydrolase [Acidimicrobiia bacterium]|nr:CocE/NonD family hydrolase [Acidimicrobiia bacterium]
MLIEWDVPIEMDDGIVLRADVFTPTTTDQYPVLLSYGPYGKGLAFQEAYPPQWEYMVEQYPEVAEGTSNRYQNWEVVDPEKWVPDGYVCVRVDSRGTGRSPGDINVWSRREALDLYHCIEWAAAQPWSNGRVGLAGISYYAMNQYQAASLQPPHLAAICPWEGASDWYREFSRHGGILCEFADNWYPRQVEKVQHGVGERGYTSAITGDLVAGPDTLEPDELIARRADLGHDIKSRPLIDQWHLERSPNWSAVKVPMLSAGNWGGHGLHLRGNIEAFVQAASEQKWLEIHGGAHWVDFYTDRGVALQKEFFDHFLKGKDNGWDRRPPVHLRIRHADGTFADRFEHQWPLARTEWTRYHLTSDAGLSPHSCDPARVEYDTAGEGVTFTTAAFETTTEITGPLAAKLFISSETNDADLFLIVRLFDTDNREVTFMGALDPNTPVAQGWLRASHRALDPERSLPYRPYHPHEAAEPLVPRQVYELDIEIWPTSIVIPPGYRLGLTVRSNDYRYDGELTDFAKSFHYANRGIGPFAHTDLDDRPTEIFDSQITLHLGGKTNSFLLVPVVPSEGASTSDNT